MTALLDYGVITYLGTLIKCLISDVASIFYGTCIFISSPSKSALYGVVTARFNLNVYPFKTLTR